LPLSSATAELDVMPARPNAFLDKLFGAGARCSAFIVVSAVAGIVIVLFIGAWPALQKFGFGFLTSSEWNPVTENFGGLVAVFGTLVSSAIAMVIAIPLSFGIAVFITELAPRWLNRPIGTAIELLAAIPSIIYGMWGLFVFAPLFAEHVQPWVSDHLGQWPILGPLFDGPPMGIGMFTAGLILAIMVLPFITAVMRDVFEIVPPVLRESAFALGATTSEVAVKVVLPYTKVGVIGGIMLGLGRALGETMAVTFVIGNAHQLSASLFMPGTTISATLANEFTEATGEIYTSSLLALGLVLFLITFIVLALAQLLIHRTRAKVAVKG
jgi:phosphate transport system permease protein